MADRPRLFDDLAGIAGGAMSALAGVRDEAEALLRSRLDEAIRKFDLVRREELEAAHDLAANARAGQEAAELRLAALEARVATLEAERGGASHPSAAATTEVNPGGNGPGMIV